MEVLKDVNKKMSDKQKVLEIYSENNKKINQYLLQKYTQEPSPNESIDK